jgi:hypothetical protein
MRLQQLFVTGVVNYTKTRVTIRQDAMSRSPPCFANKMQHSIAHFEG